MLRFLGSSGFHSFFFMSGGQPLFKPLCFFNLPITGVTPLPECVFSCIMKHPLVTFTLSSSKILFLLSKFKL